MINNAIFFTLVCTLVLGLVGLVLYKYCLLATDNFEYENTNEYEKITDSNDLKRRVRFSDRVSIYKMSDCFYNDGRNMKNMTILY